MNPTTSFVDLGVPARMAEALTAAGMTQAFPVQAITLPDALAGRDLCGRAPTGSGKTLGFGIPMMARVGQATPNRPTGLVLVPTRELAEQVQRAFVPLGRAASAEECAGAIWFLLSDEAAYMTGQAVNFTGGLVNW